MSKHTKEIFLVLERQVGNMNYLLGDFLIRFKNAVMSGNKKFTAKETKLIRNTAECLKRMGYIGDIVKKENNLEMQVAYKSKMPVLIDLKVVSRPGLRIYASVDQLEKRRKPSTLVLSTPQGVLSAKEAIKARVGGEVITEIL